MWLAHPMGKQAEIVTLRLFPDPRLQWHLCELGEQVQAAVPCLPDE